MFNGLFYRKAALLLLSILVCVNVWSGELIDPTRPLVWTAQQTMSSPVKQKIKFSLTSVFITNSFKSARINNKTVKEGALIQGAKVVSIKKNAVVLEVDGHRRVIRMKSKRPVKKIFRKQAGL